MADAWEMLGAFGHELYQHGHFCTDYVPGDRQRQRGDGTCCPFLTGGIEMEASLSMTNACCGTSYRITLKNNQGHGLGLIDCHDAAYLGPLVECGAIKVSASIDCLVHPITGRPPIMVYVRGKVPWLEAHKTDPGWHRAIASLVEILGSDGSDGSDGDISWLEGKDFELNHDAIKRISHKAMLPRGCTCSGGRCWLLN